MSTDKKYSFNEKEAEFINQTLEGIIEENIKVVWFYYSNESEKSVINSFYEVLNLAAIEKGYKKLLNECRQVRELTTNWKLLALAQQGIMLVNFGAFTDKVQNSLIYFYLDLLKDLFIKRKDGLVVYILISKNDTEWFKRFENIVNYDRKYKRFFGGERPMLNIKYFERDLCKQNKSETEILHIFNVLNKKLFF